MRRTVIRLGALSGLIAGLACGFSVASAQRAAAKPNIVIIWGDDIGQSDISAYSLGLMGFRTPNIDRVAKEGMMFTDSYAEQSCTAGRASFITGRCVSLRSGFVSTFKEFPQRQKSATFNLDQVLEKMKESGAH